MCDNKEARQDIVFLLSLVPSWAKIVLPGLDATFYGTCSYEGDLEVKNRINEIYKKWDIKKTVTLLNKGE